MAVGLFGSGAQAESEDSHHVKASLVAETQNIVAGQPLRLALRQQVEPGWHTYWSNPGKSGLPTTIDWHLPQGFKAGAITWADAGALPQILSADSLLRGVRND
jgi:thiol:disulfide interchange protein DsbD